jgi:hypothetical protein
MGVATHYQISEEQKAEREKDRIDRERVRWEYVKQVAAQEGMSLSRAIAYYSIDAKVVSPDESQTSHVLEKKEKRADKYEAILKWCSENVFTETTCEEIAQIGSISYPTALKFIKDRPDLFRKNRRGVYEVRDPKSDREAEKS